MAGDDRVSDAPGGEQTAGQVIAGLQQRITQFFAGVEIWIDPEDMPPPLLVALMEVVDVKRGRLVRKAGGHRLAWLRIDSLFGSRLRPGVKMDDIGDRLDNLPSQLVRSLKNGDRRLILDFTHEGRESEDWPFAAMEAQLEERGVDPANVIVLTQNRSLSPDDWSRTITGPKGLSVIVAHFHLIKFWQAMAMPAAGQELPPVGFAARATGDRPHRYICLNYHLRPARALVVSRLYARPESGLISFSSERFRKARKSRDFIWKLVRKLSLPEAEEDNIKGIERLFAAGEAATSYIGAGTSQQDATFGMPETELEQSEMFVITESEVQTVDLMRFTEKTLKGIIAGIPFVVFGNFGTIEAMRMNGFDTLDGLVDHSYDAEADPAKRLDMAWREVARLLDQGPGLVDRNRDGLEAAADRNARAFLAALPRHWVHRPLDQIDALLAAPAG